MDNKFHLSMNNFIFSLMNDLPLCPSYAVEESLCTCQYLQFQSGPKQLSKKCYQISSQRDTPN